MKKIHINKAVALFLTALYLLPLCGCFFNVTGFGGKGTDDVLQQQAEALVKALEADDPEAGYALMFPGVIDESVFRETFKQLYSTVPWGESWRLQQVQIQVSSSLGTDGRSKTWTGKYDLVFESRTYALAVVYMEKGEERGITGFQLGLQKLSGTADEGEAA